MKKIFMMTLLLIAIAGCSKEDSYLLDYDNSEIKDEIEELEVDFQPKLPTKTPFKVENARVEQPPLNQPIISIVFLGEEGQMMDLFITNGNVNVGNELEFEDVKIGDLDGIYTVNNQEAKILSWVDEDIHYELTYGALESGIEVSKSDLIEMAESIE